MAERSVLHVPPGTFQAVREHYQRRARMLDPNTPAHERAAYWWDRLIAYLANYHEWQCNRRLAVVYKVWAGQAITQLAHTIAVNNALCEALVSCPGTNLGGRRVALPLLLL